MNLFRLPDLLLFILATQLKLSRSLEECTFVGKNIYVNETGVITSPGFEKGTYPPKKECSWKFTGPPNKFIHLKFTDFNLQENQQCLEDYVIIEWNALDYVSNRYCGNIFPPQMTVRTSHEFYVFFNSNQEMKQLRGFRLEYSLLDKYNACPPKHLKCRNDNCVLRTKMCDGTDDCFDGTDEEKCGHKTEKPSTCGITPRPPEKGNDRIVGGRAAIPHSWPWQVSLQRIDVFPSGHFCGGALINNLWIATATHCLLNRHLSEIRIGLGMHEQYNKDGEEVIRYIEDSMIFPGYNDDALKNDISLIKLNAPVKFNERIQPICLPAPMEELSVGEMVHVTGWGETLVSGKSNVLKQVMHPVADWTKCAESHREIRPLLNTTFCAGFGGGGYATCFSDSGGPLVAEKDDLWTLYGIVSWGPITCAAPNKPSVFTKVSNYVQFINKVYQ